MNSLSRERLEEELESSLKRTLVNWGARQSPPKYLRQRVLRASAEHPALQLWLTRVQARLLGFTAQPDTDLRAWLFSRTLMRSLQPQLASLRVVS